MKTRTLEDNQRLVVAWNGGDPGSRERVIETLGGEPSEEFLNSFMPKTLKELFDRSWEVAADQDLLDYLDKHYVDEQPNEEE